MASAPGTSTRLIELEGVGRVYRRGDTKVDALRDVSLTINAGEFVAVTGPSGSGKSTLMNILGCLDTPSEGLYRCRGRDVLRLSSDELAHLRRDTFGFVFQSYNLLANASARENVELPASYSGTGHAIRAGRAQRLLESVGLGHRLGHRPATLSGGEQQRVAIARAMMNGGQILLADEPTGALDAENGRQVLRLLRSLASQGHTVIVVAHDPDLAAWAERRVELKDGKVVRDETTRDADANSAGESTLSLETNNPGPDREVPWLEALRNKISSLGGNLLAQKPPRTLLAALSVTVGVWSVVIMLAVVDGARQRSMDILSGTGANSISVTSAPRPEGGGSVRARLTRDDAEAISRQVSNIVAVLPSVTSHQLLQQGDKRLKTYINGVTHSEETARGWTLERGTFLTEGEDAGLAAVTVIGSSIRDELFAPYENPLGRHILIGATPFMVKGVLARFAPPGRAALDARDRRVLIPLGTLQAAVEGGSGLGSITVLVDDPRGLGSRVREIQDVLSRRHGHLAFNVRSNLQAQIGFSRVERLLSALSAAVAAISLLVGGAGVASIMLVSVAARTREIGIRMAVGARRRDISRQFLMEASAITLAGGLLGTLLGVASGLLLDALNLATSFAPWFVPAALGTAVATGLLAGAAPARRAANLDPVVALAR